MLAGELLVCCCVLAMASHATRGFCNSLSKSSLPVSSEPESSPSKVSGLAELNPAEKAPKKVGDIAVPSNRRLCGGTPMLGCIGNRTPITLRNTQVTL